MRLFLSSYQIGEGIGELDRLLGDRRRVALVGNAMDVYGDGDNRRLRMDRQIANFAPLNCETAELDLRHYFGKPKELEATLRGFGLIWVHGGNCFVLKRAFEQSACDQILKDMLASDAIVYGGFSAALMMVMPTLRGIELCDDPISVPPGYKPDFKWESLGLVPYSIVPHYRSSHPESPAMEAVVAYMVERAMPYRTLRDGEAVLMDKDGDRIVGKPFDFFPDQKLR